ncbi:HGxxPAAW family protein [Catenulispora subtropica]|uniref:Uncharacterized protein n=1 Tax=Catenulispora subtropica TaxID=450798 RepID=A0ABP5ESZ2_9ACTN
MSSSSDETPGVLSGTLSLSGASSSHDDHGSTPAAWTAVLLCIIGFLLGGAGLVASMPALAVVGGALALVSPLVGKIMSAMGLGAAAK